MQAGDFTPQSVIAEIGQLAVEFMAAGLRGEAGCAEMLFD
jgi:hypothetical protein